MCNFRLEFSSDFREHRCAGGPERLGARRAQAVAPLPQGPGPEGDRRRHHRRPGAAVVGARGEEGNRWRNLRPGVGWECDGMAKLTVCSARVPAESHRAACSQGELVRPLSIGDLLELYR